MNNLKTIADAVWSAKSNAGEGFSPCPCDDGCSCDIDSLSGLGGLVLCGRATDDISVYLMGDTYTGVGNANGLWAVQWDMDALRSEAAQAGDMDMVDLIDSVTGCTYEGGCWIVIDTENNGDRWWDAARDCDDDGPIALIRELLHGDDWSVELSGDEAREVMAFVATLPGWSEGDNRAPHPLLMSEENPDE